MNKKNPTITQLLSKWINEALYEARLKKCILKAEKYKSLTNHKYMVILVAGKPVVKSKQNLKSLIKSGQLRCTIQELESIAIYSTL